MDCEGAMSWRVRCRRLLDSGDLPGSSIASLLDGISDVELARRHHPRNGRTFGYVTAGERAVFPAVRKSITWRSFWPLPYSTRITIR